MTPSEPSGTGSASPNTPADTTAPATQPSGATRPAAHPVDERTKRTRTGSTWVAVGIGALILALIIVFIAQNEHTTRVYFLAWHFSFAAGLLILASAVAGALVVILIGTARLLQLRLMARRHRRQVAAATSAPPQ